MSRKFSAVFQYTLKTLQTMPIFYTKFNDIDIFIEDSDKGYSEFYSTLLSRLTGGKYKIRRIFSLKGKRNVIETCREYNTKKRKRLKRSLFITDGDLDLILVKAKPRLKNLHSLDVYCIENYLIEEKGIVEIIHDTDGTLSRSAIKSKLNYDKWVKELMLLFDLFIAYAISHANSTGIPFVKCNKIITQLNKKSSPVFDYQKTHNEIKRLEKKIKQAIPFKEYNNLERRLRNRWIKDEHNLLKIVSAKKYLLPLLGCKMHSIARISLHTRSLKIRLAKSCSLSKMRKLKKALDVVAKK